MNGAKSPGPYLEQHKCAITKTVESNLKSLWRIWDEMGIDDTQKKNRADTAIEHVNNLMSDMLKEEGNLMAKFAKTIEDFSVKLDQLCGELALPHVKLSGGLTMIQREKILRAKVEAMSREKEERLDKYKELHTQDQHLCDSLNEIPYYIPSGSIPTIEQLKELEKHVNGLQAEKNKRFAEFTDLKSKIVDLYNSLESDPDTSFGRDLVCEDDDTFALSPSNMTNLRSLNEKLIKQEQELKDQVAEKWNLLKALWNRLETPDIDREEFEMNKEGHGKKVLEALKEEIQACEQLKFQNMQKFITGIRTELVSWWDNCYFSHQQRASFQHYYSDDFTEDLLDMHEKELSQVQKYYKEHQPLLERIAQREKLFKEMIVFDEKASDPNRYFNNRGGKLLQEEKARKKLEKELPKIEEDVKDTVHNWESENNKLFHVNGMRFPQYIVQQWDDFHYKKEEQKQSRMQARAKLTKDEMLFGCKTLITTPSKRRVPNAATPQRTPLKARKLYDSSSTSDMSSKIDNSSSLAPSMAKISVSIKMQKASFISHGYTSKYRLNDLPRTPNTTSKLLSNQTSRMMSNQSRAQHSTLLHSPFARQPLYTPKTPATNKSKRRSSRLMRKAATERKSTSKRQKSRESFSHTTVSADEAASISLASTGSYNDFAGGLHKPNSRSSMMPSSSLFQLHKR